MAFSAPYLYEAVVVRVVDGDTFVLNVDLGFGVWLREQTFRLAGCNARELAEEGGREVQAYLALLLRAGTKVLLHSIKVDKWGGRFDAQIELPGIGDLTEYLILKGWVARWDGRGTKPVPAWPRPGA